MIIKEVRGKVLGYVLIFKFKFDGFHDKVASTIGVIVWGKVHNDM